MGKYSINQWKILVLYTTASACNAICLSVQAPFYPQEAERKGLQSTEYGMVFSIYFLVMFLASFVHIKFLPQIGERLLSLLGLITTGFSSLLFSSLYLINNSKQFLFYSFLIRSTEAIGTAAFSISLSSVILKEFPNNLGFSFAVTESAFGFGCLIGPLFGEVLYAIGGFPVPFMASGLMIMLVMILIKIFLHSSDSTDSFTSINPKISAFCFLRNYSFLVGLYVAFVAFFNIEFIITVLEPHLRQCHPSNMQVGLVFMIFSITYSFSAPLFGMICDKSLSPHYLWLFGTFASSLAMMFLGPAPYLNFQLSLPLSFLFVMIQGFGTGAQVVSSFSAINKYTLEAGFSEDIYTYSFISTSYNSFTYIGSFCGSLLSGIFYQKIGFPWSVHSIIFLQVILILLTILLKFEKKRK